MNSEFGLVLFSTCPSFVKRAVAAGVDAVIVDWENRGKTDRQRFADTQINFDTPLDLRRVRASTSARLLCRINSPGTETRCEVEEAIAGGADEILLPMIRYPRQVEEVLELVRDRCGVGILVETCQAVQRAEELSRLPLSRVYVGLNDLCIERNSENIFGAVRDGTVERVRRCFDVPFGFGGLTVPDGGSPIPCHLLMGEMARLGCSFSFLRRTFHREMAGRQLEAEIPRIRRAMAEKRRRSPTQIACEKRQLDALIAACLIGKARL